jgi:hypothetical protein
MLEKLHAENTALTSKDLHSLITACPNLQYLRIQLRTRFLEIPEGTPTGKLEVLHIPCMLKIEELFEIAKWCGKVLKEIHFDARASFASLCWIIHNLDLFPQLIKLNGRDIQHLACRK